MGSGLTAVLDLARDHPETVGARLAEQAALIPDRTLLVTQDGTITYAEMERRARIVAAGFQLLGVRKGDLVCQFLPNCEAMIVNWMGLAKLGAVHAPVNYQFQGEALARLLNLAEAKVLVLDAGMQGSIAEIAGELPCLETILLRTGGETLALDARLARFAVHDLATIEKSEAEPGPVEVHYADPAIVMFTSGTTGPSKAVEISHRYALTFAALYVEHWRLVEEDVLYTAYPLYHVDASLSTFLCALHRGARAVIMPKFSVSRFWDDVRRHGVTITTFMGAVATFLVNRPEAPDDADNPLRLALCAPLIKRWREFEERFGVKVVSGYGGTEMPIVTWSDLDEPLRDDSCGRISPHYEIRIGDPFDEALPPGQVGEILVRARRPYTMFSGYYRNPEATARALRNQWMRLNDLGFLDEDGTLHFVGRSKDVIRRRGENISAFEVEEVLAQHPAVHEVAVIGVPSEYTEEEVKAVVAQKPGQTIAPTEIIEWAEGRLPRYALPRFIEFTTELPHTETDKVQKSGLRENWRNAHTFDVETDGYLEP